MDELRVQVTQSGSANITSCSSRSSAARRYTGNWGSSWELLRKLATQKESRIEEGHLMPDHVHMMISIPPKYAVSQVIGYVKGKSAIHLARFTGNGGAIL